MSARAFLVAAMAVAAGCSPSSDPCSGAVGTCLGVTLTSSVVKQVDTLTLVASGAFSGTRMSTTGKPSPLPIRVQVHYPGPDAGMLHLDVEASLAGVAVGHGAGDTTITPGRRSAITLELVGGASLLDFSVVAARDLSVAGTDAGDDLAVADLVAPPD